MRIKERTSALTAKQEADRLTLSKYQILAAAAMISATLNAAGCSTSAYLSNSLAESRGLGALRQHLFG